MGVMPCAADEGEMRGRLGLKKVNRPTRMLPASIWSPTQQANHQCSVDWR
jgi:hypothetical protein